MIEKINTVCLKVRDVEKSSKRYQELHRFKEVFMDDGYLVISVGNDSIPKTNEVEDTDSITNQSYSGYRFISKLFVEKTKNNLTLESTPMVF